MYLYIIIVVSNKYLKLLKVEYCKKHLVFDFGRRLSVIKAMNLGVA